MRIITGQSIRTKLTLLIMVTSGIAVLVSSMAFVLNDFATMRRSKVEQLTALADVIAHNSTAAISFRQKQAAEELLLSLHSRHTIKYACLFDNDNRIFASYNSGMPPGFLPTAPKSHGHQFTGDGYLDIVLPIAEYDDRLGSIYVRATMNDLEAQLWQYVNIATCVLAGSLLVAVALSFSLQRTVSAPILSLAATAKQISDSRDYSFRVTKQSNDEIGVLYDHFNQMLDRIQDGEAKLRKAHDELEARVQERTQQLETTNQQLQETITQRERDAHKIEAMHHQLVDAARKAGMAEIAADVLHNIGNVLNSINVTTTILREKMQKSEIKDLNRALAMMEQHPDDLASFITSDAKGRNLPVYLCAAGRAIEQERTEVMEGIESLVRNIDHIKTVIATQQAYAGVSGMVQTVSLVELLDDSLQVSAAMLQRHGIQVITECEDLPPISVDKHRLLQILVNLLKNAKEAVTAKPLREKRITLRAGKTDDGMIRIDVSDNGTGITQENLSRIFSHGFTTKPSGNGLGLHSSALAAEKMGGSLHVHSDGPGAGATFTIQLPFTPVKEIVQIG